MEILNDLLDYNLDIVVCGTAVGNNSAKTKSYYAGNGNKFYETLKLIGLTKDKQLKPEEYEELLNYKIGLTDLVKKVSGNDIDLVDTDYDVASFISKIAEYKPKIVVFNGKESARVFQNLKRTKDVSYGIISNLSYPSLKSTKFYVATSTSNQASKYWDIETWKVVNV